MTSPVIYYKLYFDNICLTKEQMMPFSKGVFMRAVERAGFRCEKCGKDVSKVEKTATQSPCDIHSVTGLHLVRHKKQPSACIVTSPPASMMILRGRMLPVYGFVVFSLGRDDDGFCLCQDCHNEVHTLALSITKDMLPSHTGMNSSPAVLELVSLTLIMKKSTPHV